MLENGRCKSYIGLEGGLEPPEMENAETEICLFRISKTISSKNGTAKARKRVFCILGARNALETVAENQFASENEKVNVSGVYRLSSVLDELTGDVVD
ncbi:Uncharacterized protein TCM_010284 [Theobroma cacao]|uniref:Uncharacterized protein n=1 Tax=Theobroma cacao TaxID=3641 RepID=A0A061E5X0_THECC|nr:Uncharacterized protein TCM_010284 [Theobroma cacao]